LGATLAVALVAAAPALAEIEVRQLKLEKGYVVLKVASSDGVSKGSILEAHNDGELCRLKVYYVKGSQAAATTRDCPTAPSISIGQVFENLSGVSGEGPTAVPRSSDEREALEADRITRHHFGLHAYYSLASQIDEKYSASGTLSGTPINSTFTNTYVTSGSPGAGIRYAYVKRHRKPKAELNVGGMGAFSFDLGRSITESTTASGVRSTYTDLNLSVSEFELNLLGEYKSFYAFLGPNVSFLSVSGRDADPDRSTSGALGLQVGAGYRFGPVGFETVYRVINGTVSSLVEGVEVQTEQERLWGLMLRMQIFLSI
jgi:hypothetical protein